MRGSRFLVGLGALAALLVSVALALPLGAHVERDPFFVDPAPDTSITPAAGGDYVQARSIDDPTKRLASFRSMARRVWKPGLSERQAARLRERFVRLSENQQARALKIIKTMRARTARGPSAAELGLSDPKLQAEETLVVCRPDSLARLKTSIAQVGLRRAAGKRLLARNRAFRKLCRFDEIQKAVTAADNNDSVLIMPGFYTEPTSRARPHDDPACAKFVASGSRSAPSPTYEYHFRCPNDLSLIAVLGRDLDGRCIRCNLHIVGTGAKPEDVLIEVAKNAVDPGVSSDLFEEGKGQLEGAKEVGIRLERTDGAYVGNLTVRNASEHGLYSIEADGVTFDRIKAYYNREYGHLSFVTDHLIVQDGDFAGSSDAGVYPGASPPSAPRLNSIIRRNDSHHNAIGLSGSMGSSLHIVDNDFHDNSTGITLDSISRTGHPGYPQRGTLIERNRIYSNNFDTYSDKAWVRSSVQAPIGAGVIFAGGNDNVTHRNHIFDNWKWGVALITVPDIVTEQNSPDDARISTSHRNRQVGNFMGVKPDGTRLPNGVDFWWDELGEANCWERNGDAITSDPAQLPDCQAYPNIGHGNAVKEVELVNCNFVAAREPGQPGCDWYEVPEKP